VSDTVQHRLQERTKELSALHGTARLLQSTHRSVEEVASAVAALLPGAWQYPEVAASQIRCGEDAWSTPAFDSTRWSQVETFRLRDGTVGDVTVVYLEERPPADEGPFLAEERELLRTLAEMIRAFFQHRRDDAVILAAKEGLERQVADRTASLRRLASEASLTEERERRRIAGFLHDHLGQGLAVIKIKLQRLRADAMLSGHGRALDDLIQLSDQAIRYTRDLTFDLSPPMLYELGLGPTLEWLAERTSGEEGLEVSVRDRCRADLPDDLKVMLWKSARELVHNVVKHSGARRADILLESDGDRILLSVADDGCGFDRERVREDSEDRFGLYSIEERIQQLGGRMTVSATPDHGATVGLEVPLGKGAA
jgi:signal transduction histidine kinase